ncbi:uncharacterized protein MELLADRAFT_89435 [Melampsora larici-populina 98AG31]|uniref:Uncharacterized protein n=1 Tax=Melampsora larici-populina (strain 98AG31 / pathotype 3-4-7) TaxID=747676 RepID=F4RTB6_MELLP|nr:uncharacterized protein MELLADRAFT_89435 [Melampsora larici-populina 98AG31]EGG04235.1 hypothetical protein MELLADRAFT_89435 [Melampsora larici-populina 98AG31]
MELDCSAIGSATYYYLRERHHGSHDQSYLQPTSSILSKGKTFCKFCNKAGHDLETCLTAKHILDQAKGDFIEKNRNKSSSSSQYSRSTAAAPLKNKGKQLQMASLGGSKNDWDQTFNSSKIKSTKSESKEKRPAQLGKSSQDNWYQTSSTSKTSSEIQNPCPASHGVYSKRNPFKSYKYKSFVMLFQKEVVKNYYHHTLNVSYRH